jgi:hypothetical protein
MGKNYPTVIVIKRSRLELRRARISERPEVQKGILNAIASPPEVAQKLEKAIEVRHAQVHDQGYDHSL